MIRTRVNGNEEEIPVGVRPVYSRIPDDANTNMNRDGDGDRPAHDLTHNENSGSPMPQHRELHEDNLNRGVDVHPVNVNGSRGRTMDTANRNIHEAGCHCGHCEDTTCPSCQQVVRVSNPSEETSRALGVMGLSVRENGRERSHSTTPTHLCPECSARVSSGAQLQAGRQEDGEASPREFDRISEAQLEGSKRKVISDIPLDVRQTVCHCLDGEYRSLTNGRVAFAIEMNISEVEARAAKDADTIILKLLTQRVPVYKILKALDKIERDDAVHVIARWLQHSEHS